MEMQPHEITEALRRPPVFGDPQQIAALKALRRAEDEEEKEREAGKKQYKVGVEYSISEDITVWAKDEGDARQIARDLVDIYDGEWDMGVTAIGGN